MATPRTKKHYIPLESNPEVFTSLSHKLGVDPALAWTDVFSLDDPELLAFIPRPVIALVLVFPTSPKYLEDKAKVEDAREAYTGGGEAEDMLWFKQTIGNACGLYGILHSVSNGDSRARIQPESPLATLIQQGTPLTPKSRARLLEDSKDLEVAHHAAATQGDSAVPDAEDEVDYHYICFVKSHKNGHLYQMDGASKGPLDLGPLLKPDEDLLAGPVVEVIKKYTHREVDGGVHFNLLALVPNLDNE